MKHARPDYDRFQDPWGKIPEDEPVFLLRGQDKIAWHVVKIYAYCLELAGGSAEMVAMCRDHAAKMKVWAHKVPDLPGEGD